MNERAQKIWVGVALLLAGLLAGTLIALFIYPGWLRPKAEPVIAADPRIDQLLQDMDEVKTMVSESKPTAKAVAETHTSLALPETNPSAHECRSNMWMEEAIADTGDVASLISLLDRDFTLDDGGQWSEPGYTVPEVAVFWTDLFENVSNLPGGVSVVRVQGGWGVYYTTIEYVIPKPNGGGRWMRLCGALEVPKAAVEVAPVVEVAPAEAVGCVLPDLTGKTVAQAINAMDQWFEDTAYQWGGTFAKGDTLPAGSYFWTDLGEGFERPECLKELVAEGNWGVFQTSQSLVSPSAGRYVVCN